MFLEDMKRSQTILLLISDAYLFVWLLCLFEFFLFLGFHFDVGLIMKHFTLFML